MAITFAHKTRCTSQTLQSDLNLFYGSSWEKEIWANYVFESLNEGAEYRLLIRYYQGAV